MGTPNELSGREFGRWFVLAKGHVKGKVHFWKCVCSCGTEREVNAYSLTSGSSVSCGCFNREASSAYHSRHGMSGHTAYGSWRAMRNRCEVPSADGYSEYGGRGIRVCDAWHSFDNFWRDMGPTWNIGLSIDRLDVNGNYEPSNCRWATPKEQAANRRTARIIQTPDGEMSVTQAAEKYGISRKTINARLRYGWTDPHQLVSKASDFPRSSGGRQPRPKEAANP